MPITGVGAGIMASIWLLFVNNVMVSTPSEEVKKVKKVKKVRMKWGYVSVKLLVRLVFIRNITSSSG